MEKSTVSVVKYEKPLESVKKAIDLSKGFNIMPSNAKIFIKPNIVFWTRKTEFPKWGVITTSRIIEDIVTILHETGVRDITIAEGTVLMDPKDTVTPAHAYETLGYNELKKRYGVKVMNIFERPFENVDLGDGVSLNFNTDILNSDFVVNIPVLKTHNMTIVSLGIKNLKGMIDIASRKKCHNTDPIKDLNFMIAKLADKMPPMFTLIDGIYSSERGPNVDGKMHRRDLLIASSDVLSADMTGAMILGYNPIDVPHLARAAKNRNRPADLSDVHIVGESVASVSSFHRYIFPWNEENTLPVPMDRMGIKGLSYPKYDYSLCTYCAGFTSYVLMSIALAWKGEPWDDVEFLTGKVMKPSPGMKKTILFGKCMCRANREDPNINELIQIKGCPPQPENIIKALHQAGIDVDPAILENIDTAPGYFMTKYADRPEFDEAFFKVGKS